MISEANKANVKNAGKRNSLICLKNNCIDAKLSNSFANFAVIYD